VFLLTTVRYWGSLITAGLVVSSVLQPSGSESLAEALERNERVCINGWVRDSLVEKSMPPARSESWSQDHLPRIIVPLEERRQAPDTLAGSLELMDDGVCQHTLAELESFKYVLARTGEEHCDKGAIGNPTMTPFSVAFPVRTDLEPIISAMMLNSRERYTASWDQAEAALGLKCSARLSEKNQGSGSGGGGIQRFKVKHISTELFILVLAGFISLMLAYHFPDTPEELGHSLARAVLPGRKKPQGSGSRLQSAKRPNIDDDDDGGGD